MSQPQVFKTAGMVLFQKHGVYLTLEGLISISHTPPQKHSASGHIIGYFKGKFAKSEDSSKLEKSGVGSWQTVDDAEKNWTAEEKHVVKEVLNNTVVLFSVDSLCFEGQEYK